MVNKLLICMKHKAKKQLTITKHKMQQDKNVTSNNMKPIVSASLSYHWHSINTTNLTETFRFCRRASHVIWTTKQQIAFYFAVWLAQMHNAHDLVMFSVSFWTWACDWQVVAMAAEWQLSSKRLAAVFLQLLAQLSECWKESYQHICVFIKQASSISRMHWFHLDCNQLS